ncbi:MAG: class IV adenylate cyclase [Acidobacteriota bacterium]|nr:class IV adenylate cyclase [Blastocatellia bacterium]MDW8412536.1 class IV adenylate cyclase [Acidobacteriota bacterium]
MTTVKNIEIEVKIPCDDIKILEKIGQLMCHKPRHFEDNWMLDNAGVLAAKQEALRLRVVDGKATLTFKGLSDMPSDFKSRLEYETEVADPKQMLSILARLGYRPFFRYQKYRTIYILLLESGLSLQAMFDETPMGNFLELEGCELAVRQAIEALALTQDEYITTTYIQMQADRCSRLGLPLRDLVFSEQEDEGDDSCGGLWDKAVAANNR